MAKKDPGSQNLLVAQNRRARHDYTILSTLETGIVLVGTEVKSLRTGQSSINEAHAGIMEGELYLFNAHIPEYVQANRFNHELRRPRKLLVRRRELNRIIGAIKKKGITLVPLSIYFNKKGRVKVEIATAQGKKLIDKRETIKERDWNRDRARILKNQRD